MYRSGGPLPVVNHRKRNGASVRDVSRSSTEAVLVNCRGMINGARVVWQIVPRISDNPDGVTDYAFNLANDLWANLGLRTVFAPGEPSQASKKGEFEIASIADAGAPPAKPAHVILHYVNYGYQKRGLPFWLVPILRRVRETFGGRLVVIFHELFAS